MMRTDHMMRLSCLSEQLVLMDTKRGFIRPWAAPPNIGGAPAQRRKVWLTPTTRVALAEARGQRGQLTPTFSTAGSSNAF